MGDAAQGSFVTNYEGGMRWVVLAAVVLAGCTAASGVESEVDAPTFCAGQMGHAPGTAKYQACVQAQIGANREGAARVAREAPALSREELDYRLRVYEATRPQPYVPYQLPQPYVMQPPRSTSITCVKLGNIVRCDTD